MKNLKLVHTRAFAENDALCDIHSMSLDTEQNNVYIANSTHIVCINSEGQVISSIAIQESVTEANCVPVGLQYISDQQALCLATSDGRLSLWYLSNPDELECVGEVESGVTAMGWSPDSELIIITTGDKKLLLMTREFDVICEVGMFPNYEGEDGHITVGWGKKETQFHGSSGKQAAKCEEININPASEHDKGEPRISWRGDGQFFVISAIEQSTGGRFLYTWSRECVFQARSEPVDGVQNSLSWKPSGSLIASVQKTNSSPVPQIIFYEKNGLRHGEFTLQDVGAAGMKVQFISWNHDSTVLAVCLDSIESDSKSILQLWTVNNYHWYLKQSLPFVHGISAASWDPEHAYRMHLMTRAGAYMTLTWAWHVDCTLGQLDDDDALVAVIDGKQLLVTPFRKMVVPPPMSAYCVTLPNPVSSVAFITETSGCHMAVLLANGQLAIFSYQGVEGKNFAMVSYTGAGGGDGFSPQCCLPGLDDFYSIKFQQPQELPTVIHHLLWLGESQLLFITSVHSCSLLHVADVCKGNKSVVVRTTVELKSFVLTLAKNEETNTVAIQFLNGEVFKYLSEGDLVQPWLSPSGQSVSFPYPCADMAVTSIGQQEMVVGRTDRFRFFVNSTEIATNCTSFKVHNEFILLTTFSHTLRCISRSYKLQELASLSDTKSHPLDESIRRVERGSQIINVVANGTKVILQMPRGNLETIHPRALVLSSLKHFMDSDKMLEAFLMMRTHRINLNLLHDHNPTHFLTSIDNFIQTVDSPAHFNVFLTDLVEQDVTQTMYTASYPTRQDNSVTQSVQTSKVNRICDSFLEGLQKAGSDRFYQSILTAHVRKNPPDLEKALLVVWSLYGRDKSEKCASPDDALKYLLFLVDVNDLYNVALGMYNFDLVLMVAGKSQKDPKEYIPFLNQLRTLEENYRYYTIDKHLKKYSTALKHLAKCGDERFQELLTLVSDQKLHAKALSLYKPGTAQFKSIAAMYGNYLRTKNRHDEAGIMFIKAEEWELAMEAFRASRNWQQVFCMAGHLNYCSNRLSELAVKVADELRGAQLYRDAATVLEEYAQDIEEAIVALIQGSFWEESLRLMHRYKRLDLIETHLKEALEESWDHSMEMLSSQKAQFLQYKNRLAVVRAQKEKEKSELDGGEWNEAGADLFSDTSSITGATVTSLATSNSSRSTVISKTGSARTRRKAENKKWSLKEGSANEGFALVDALAKQIVVIYSMKEELSSLMKMLVQFNYDDKATRLHNIYDEFLTLIDSSIGQIWNQSHVTGTGMTVGPNSTSSSVARAVQSGHKVTDSEQKLEPVLLIPPSLNKDTRWKLHIASKHTS